MLRRKFSRIARMNRRTASVGREEERKRKRERDERSREHGCMEPTGRDARAGASVVGGKREFALSHPRIYPTPSSQGAGLRYHPCRPAPRPSVFSPAFFSPIGRPSRRPADDAPFADRTRVGVRVLDATSPCSLPLCRWRSSRGSTIDLAPLVRAVPVERGESPRSRKIAYRLR